MSDTTGRDKIRLECEELGENEVRNKLNRKFKTFNHVQEVFTKEWLREKEETRRKSDRTEELTLSKKANVIANEAKESSIFSNKIALVALILSLIALAISIFKP